MSQAELDIYEPVKDMTLKYMEANEWLCWHARAMQAPILELKFD